MEWIRLWWYLQNQHEEVPTFNYMRKRNIYEASEHNSSLFFRASWQHCTRITKYLPIWEWILWEHEKQIFERYSTCLMLRAYSEVANHQKRSPSCESCLQFAKMIERIGICASNYENKKYSREYYWNERWFPRTVIATIGVSARSSVVS